VSTPTPTPSASPTPQILQFESTGEGPTICHTFADWNSATETIVITYSGYEYTFSASGVMVTYSTGPESGQTQSVMTATTLTYGSDQCVVSVSSGAIQSIVQNF
jgi:hypothetical protein